MVKAVLKARKTSFFVEKQPKTQWQNPAATLAFQNL